MQVERRSFQRQGEERRREALLAAALDLVAEGGPQAATVRAIAERAGVSAGLIRHYFSSKESLIHEAYSGIMMRMTEEGRLALRGLPEDPALRLSTFVATSLRPPVMDARQVGIWAGFLHQARGDAALRDIHESTYLAYRDVLQGLIRDLPGFDDPGRSRALAIACNAVIDGLWLEGSLLPGSFAGDEVEAIGISAIGRLLGIDLPEPAPAVVTA